VQIRICKSGAIFTNVAASEDAIAAGGVENVDALLSRFIATHKEQIEK